MPEDSLSRSHDLNVRAIVGAAAALAVVIGISLGGTWWMMRAWDIFPGTGGPDAPMSVGIVGAVLESSPQIALQDYVAEKQRLLSSYQWLDPQRTAARIPVDKAMALLVARSRKAGVEGRDKP